ncbi:DUF1146 family protein [Sediminibacillus halophilus]|uniref:Conserved hypothetical integral membrane protein n=1 Tax=Sediminibacillus halophilus TaxID=482461 RepID=A0A1G9U0R2_9BACI|nr:DUF1146 family protein [Sediminibacillus halophilus]SDM53526.1 conserved hypothetical integral membrane protein [Sediminibacillus halophilus]
MMQSLGQEALISMISHLIFIIITWRILQGINLEPLIKKGRVMEANILLIFITIAIGTTVSRFFLDFLQWSQQLIFLF